MSSTESFFDGEAFKSVVAEANKHNVSVKLNLQKKTFTLTRSTCGVNDFSIMMVTQPYRIETEQERKQILDEIESFANRRPLQ